MRKLYSWLVGFGIGGVIALGLVLLLSPFSGRELRERLRQHVNDAMEAGHKAALEKRAELEREFAEALKKTAP